MEVTLGSVDVTLIFPIKDTREVDGSRLSGVLWNAAGLTCKVVKPGVADQTISLATQTWTGSHSDGGFVEDGGVSGMYRLDLPDNVFASYLSHVVIVLEGAANMAPVELRLEMPKAGHAELLDLHDRFIGGKHEVDLETLEHTFYRADGVTTLMTLNVTDFVNGAGNDARRYYP